MLLPSIFDDKFVDRFFDDMFSFPAMFRMPASSWMETNIKDMGNEYELEIGLPGYDKKDIHAHLENGYLTISAEKQDVKEDKEKGKYIRRERYFGSCKRSFYVGNNLKEEDFHASFENGILKLTFPKEDSPAKIEQKKYIEIE
ncbi:Hsp20/alpha crystallin family protein [Lachnospiraceae bacterium MD1]|uniref:Hsp20/alpha crystallin family protein n=1 Tax=Variimorphobacter saccharofermentans TaxID=2755051 RepID=A0A839JYJ0_9FIRM|nr:Hsp20/alpha crystallin family protein [Variimorphobacter saccharofermentans]MBB2181669.1 Hsp20/alpha crystallin family protein [Variimorphobacter saccharofermentans]